LDIIPNSKIEITCNSKVFEDVKEVLIWNY
jgi:hypothetical protein